MMIHRIRIDNKYYNHVKFGFKKFEYRKDDRGYSVGDLLILQETVCGLLTGEYYVVVVTYILRDVPQYGLPEGYCILGIEELEDV